MSFSLKSISLCLACCNCQCLLSTWDSKNDRNPDPSITCFMILLFLFNFALCFYVFCASGLFTYEIMLRCDVLSKWVCFFFVFFLVTRGMMPLVRQLPVFLELFIASVNNTHIMEVIVKPPQVEAQALIFEITSGSLQPTELITYVWNAENECIVPGDMIYHSSVTLWSCCTWW